MAYCRWGADSDVYAFKDVLSGCYCCMGCGLKGSMPTADAIQGFNRSDADFYAETPEEFLQHLKEHREAGHAVPDGALRRLAREIRDG